MAPDWLLLPSMLQLQQQLWSMGSPLVFPLLLLAPAPRSGAMQHVAGGAEAESGAIHVVQKEGWDGGT